MEENNNKQDKPIKNNAIEYTKQNLANSKKFKEDKDIINALLEENKKYSEAEVKEIIKKYKERIMK